MRVRPCRLTCDFFMVLCELFCHGLSCKKHRFCDRFCERRWSQHFCRVVHCRGLACVVSGSGSVLSKSLTAQQDSQTAHRKIRMQLSMPHCWQGWLAFVQHLQEPQNLRNGWIMLDLNSYPRVQVLCSSFFLLF